jgi:hypothetical protein
LKIALCGFFFFTLFIHLIQIETYNLNGLRLLVYISCRRAGINKKLKEEEN